MSETTIKSVTGGDVITARKLYKDSFSFLPAFQMFLATNHVPAFTGQDEGFWRRVRLIEFKRFFAPGDRDQYLVQKLANEAPGVLAWAVEGAVAWHAAGKRLPTSPTISAATESYREESDVLGDFLRENVQKVDDKKVITFAKALVTRYQEWSDEQGDKKPNGSTRFARMIDERLGPRVKTAQPRCWPGVRLLPLAEVRSRQTEGERHARQDVRPLKLASYDGC